MMQTPKPLAVTFLLALVQLVGSQFPVHLLPFINYYEVYPLPNNFVPLDQPQGYVASLAMLYLAVMGTLGYLPLNLKDIAKFIDKKKSRKRWNFNRRHGLQRRQGHAGQVLRHRQGRFRGKRAVTDRQYLAEFMTTIDPDNCLLQLICEAEFLGPTEATPIEHRLIHKLFRLNNGDLEKTALGAWARRGRVARENHASSPCPDLTAGRCVIEKKQPIGNEEISSQQELDRQRFYLGKLEPLLSIEPDTFDLQDRADSTALSDATGGVHDNAL